MDFEDHESFSKTNSGVFVDSSIEKRRRRSYRTSDISLTAPIEDQEDEEALPPPPSFSCTRAPLNPTGSFMGRWDFFTTMLLVWTALVTPYEVGFTVTKLGGMFWMNRFIDCCFFVDMLITLHLPFQDKFGNLNTDLNQIAVKYLKKWFWIDLVSTIPFDAFSVLVDSSVSKLKVLRVVRLMRLVKMLRIFRGARVLARFERRYAINYAAMNIYKYLISQFVICHWMACAWGAVVSVDPESELSWMERFPYVTPESPAARKYLASLYWACATITTLSYGDIYPATDVEKVLMLAAMIVGAATYAYVIGGVCGILSQLSAATQDFNDSMDMLNSFLVEKGVTSGDRELCERLRTFYQYNFAHGLKSIVAKSEAIMNDLTISLRGSMAESIHSVWMSQLPFFKDLPDKTDFYMGIALAMVPVVRAPREPVFLPADEVSGLYVVEKGLVAVKGRLFRAPDPFGFDAFYRTSPGDRWEYAAMSLSHVTLSMLPIKELWRILDMPQNLAVRCKVRKNAVKVQCREIFRSIIKSMRRALKAPTFQAGYDILKEQNVAKSSLVVWNFILHRSSDARLEELERTAITLQRIARNARIMQRTLASNARLRMELRHERALEELGGVLQPLGFLHYLPLLYQAGIDTAEVLNSCTGPELLAAGLPLGVVKRLQLGLVSEELAYQERRIQEIKQFRRSLVTSQLEDAILNEQDAKRDDAGNKSMPGGNPSKDQIQVVDELVKEGMQVLNHGDRSVASVLNSVNSVDDPANFTELRLSNDEPNSVERNSSQQLDVVGRQGSKPTLDPLHERNPRDSDAQLQVLDELVKEGEERLKSSGGGDGIRIFSDSRPLNGVCEQIENKKEDSATTTPTKVDAEFETSNLSEEKSRTHTSPVRIPNSGSNLELQVTGEAREEPLESRVIVGTEEFPTENAEETAQDLEYRDRTYDSRRHIEVIDALVKEGEERLKDCADVLRQEDDVVSLSSDNVDRIRPVSEDTLTPVEVVPNVRTSKDALEDWVLESFTTALDTVLPPGLDSVRSAGKVNRPVLTIEETAETPDGGILTADSIFTVDAGPALSPPAEVTNNTPTPAATAEETASQSKQPPSPLVLESEKLQEPSKEANKPSRNVPKAVLPSFLQNPNLDFIQPKEFKVLHSKSVTFSDASESRPPVDKQSLETETTPIRSSRDRLMDDIEDSFNLPDRMESISEFENVSQSILQEMDSASLDMLPQGLSYQMADAENNGEFAPMNPSNQFIALARKASARIRRTSLSKGLKIWEQT